MLQSVEATRPVLCASLCKVGKTPLMKIRRAAISDVPALVCLNRGVQDMHADAFPERFRRDAPEEIVERAVGAMIQAPGSYWLVAEEDHPIAFLSAEFREREESWCFVAHQVCYLAGIVVAPRFRRRGIARALVGELKREADTRGVTGIELDVWAFNEPARQVFTRLGFRGMMERMTLAAENVNNNEGRRRGTFKFLVRPYIQFRESGRGVP